MAAGEEITFCYVPLKQVESEIRSEMPFRSLWRGQWSGDRTWF